VLGASVSVLFLDSQFSDRLFHRGQRLSWEVEGHREFALIATLEHVRFPPVWWIVVYCIMVGIKESNVKRQMTGLGTLKCHSQCGKIGCYFVSK
jgi:hypothetical protein